MINPLNIKAKDLCVLYGVSETTAKRRIRGIKTQFNIIFPQTVTYIEVAAYFGHDINILLQRLREAK